MIIIIEKTFALRKCHLIPSGKLGPISSDKGAPLRAVTRVPARRARQTNELGARRLLRGACRCNGMWRDGVSPVSSRARTRSVKVPVVGWATAESPAAGFGADHDRMTSLHKSKLIVEPLAALVQGLG